MSLVPTDLKKGVIFLLNGELYESLSYEQKVIGRQRSTVSIKARQLQTNKIQRHAFSGSEDLKEASLEKITVEFLYSDKGKAFFMSEENFEQYLLPVSKIEKKMPYLPAGAKVILILFEDKPLTVVLPKNVFLKVTAAKEAVRGNTTGSVMKEAEVETGLLVKVPAFIKIGDVISVDTENGFYRERQKSPDSAG